MYNDKELIDDTDLGCYGYGFCNYDPQIARFPQLDPLAFKYSYLNLISTPVALPITNSIVDRLEGASGIDDSLSWKR